MRAGKIGWQRFRGRCHTATESYSSAAAKQNRHPADVGRQVSCGWRQSIPDSKYPSCADEIVTAPSADRKSTRLNSSHTVISYAVFCLKKKNKYSKSKKIK